MSSVARSCLGPAFSLQPSSVITSARTNIGCALVRALARGKSGDGKGENVLILGSREDIHSLPPHVRGSSRLRFLPFDVKMRRQGEFYTHAVRVLTPGSRTFYHVAVPLEESPELAPLGSYQCPGDQEIAKLWKNTFGLAKTQDFSRFQENHVFVLPGLEFTVSSKALQDYDERVRNLAGIVSALPNRTATVVTVGPLMYRYFDSGRVAQALTQLARHPEQFPREVKWTTSECLHYVRLMTEIFENKKDAA